MSVLLPILVSATGLAERDVRSIVRTAPSRYAHFTIAKRNGGRRLISQPARELKALQRVLVAELLDQLPVHKCASAYRPSQSIGDNAVAHAGDGPILKMDFKDFFPSFRAADWINYCNAHGVLSNDEDIYISRNVFFCKGTSSSLCLAIGAPSSPSLSNVLMYEFDEKICTAVSDEKVRYTRYADDLTFSAERTGYLVNVKKTVGSTVAQIRNPRLRINEEKTVTATRKFRRVVTGLVLTNDGSVSLGKERKKRIRAACHYALHGKLSPASEMQLAGMIAFAHDVEPDFVLRLQARYGTALFDRLRRVKKTPWPIREDGTAF